MPGMTEMKEMTGMTGKTGAWGVGPPHRSFDRKNSCVIGRSAHRSFEMQQRARDWLVHFIMEDVCVSGTVAAQQFCDQI